LKGKYFEVPAFSRKVWKNEAPEIDGDLLDKHKNEVT
jgi:hypothetical protein